MLKGCARKIMQAKRKKQMYLYIFSLMFDWYTFDGAFTHTAANLNEKHIFFKQPQMQA